MRILGRARTWATLVVVALLAAGTLVMATSAPASAKTIYGSYFNAVTGKYQATYTYLDCDCPDDGALSIRNFDNGYNVRALVHAKVGGTWYRYLDRLVPPGYSAKYATGYPPEGVQVRLRLCTVNRSGEQKGSCSTYYTINSHY